MRGPVHDSDCERQVLADLIIRWSDFALVDDILDETCFHSAVNRDIYLAIRSLIRKGAQADMVAVSAELRSMGSSVSALDVTALCTSTLPTQNLVYHARLLRSLSMRRRLWEIGLRMVAAASSEIESVEEIHTEAKAGIDSLFETADSCYETFSDAYSQLQQRMLINRDLQSGATYGTPTGFPRLDQCGGLPPGSLWIIGAETSMGKTSFATSLTLSALRSGRSVAFYSLEMTPVELSARIGSMLSGVSSSTLMYKPMSVEQIYCIDEAVSHIDGTRLLFDGRSTSSLDSILASIRSMKARFGIDGAVVDYLQLVNVKSDRLNREQSVARVARDLKNIAKELGIWIVALSQLARDNRSPIPTMARLRDSGQIEEAADTVLLIYRPAARPEARLAYPDPYAGVPTAGTALVFIGKGRNIGTGEFLCRFRADTTTFSPLTEADIQRLRIECPDESFPGDDEPLPF